MQLVLRNGVYYAKGKIAGKLYRESTGFREGGRKALDNARRRMVEIENAIRAGEHGWTKSVITLGDWWTRYYATYSTQKSHPERDEQMMAHAMPFFGATTPLDKIKKSECLGYLNHRRGMVAANPLRKTPKLIAEGTVSRERSFLQAVFQQAVEDEHIERNPWKGIPRTEYEVRDRVLSDSEQIELLSRLSPRFQRFVLFLLGTGIRLEECRGIDPVKDLDFRKRLVTVTGKFSKTRQVPLPGMLVPLLKDQLREDGKLWTQNQQRFRAVLTRACRERSSGHGVLARPALTHLSPHALRHTYGWRYLRGGGDIYSLSKILGHASVSVTEKHYAQLLKEDLVVKADAVDLGIAASVELVGAAKGRVLEFA